MTTATRELTTTFDEPVTVSGLQKAYGGRVAVAGIDLAVHRGEVFALLGPNGAGKTSTVEILEGIRRRDGGTVRVLGLDPNDDRRSWRARIGIVPQGTSSFPDLTVGEVLNHFSVFYPHPLPVGQVLDMVGLTAARKKQASSLSGGQQRRLDVGVGIVGDPELLFLDEPTTGLDPVARRDAWDLVRYFADRGTTTLLTTHYLDEAEALAARAAVIVDGRVVRSGPIAELGGPASDHSTISFQPPTGLLVRSAALLGDGAVTDPNGVVSVRTAMPTAVLGRLLDFARSVGLEEVPMLRVYHPTLEEIYLELIASHRKGADGDTAH